MDFSQGGDSDFFLKEADNIWTLRTFYSKVLTKIKPSYNGCRQEKKRERKTTASEILPSLGGREGGGGGDEPRKKNGIYRHT